MIATQQTGTTTGQCRAIVVHALHKSASMFLYQLMFRLARDRGIPFYSSNHPKPNDHELSNSPGFDFCLGPVRTFEMKPDFCTQGVDARRIYQVRDPRDILVSQYYSLGWIHTPRQFSEEQQQVRTDIQECSIDEYVLNQQEVINPLTARINKLLNRELNKNETIVHYEQMIEDFDGWLAKIIQPFDFRVEKLIRWKYRLRFRNEFKADSAMSHKRSVVPGDYKRQLKPETIKELNRRFRQILLKLGYENE